MKAFLFLFVTILLLQSLSTATAFLEETCTKVIRTGNTGINYVFCITSLQVHIESRNADTQGLAVIASNLARANFTHNMGKVTDLLNDPKIPNTTKDAVHDCLSLYEEGGMALDKAIREIKSHDINGAATSLAASTRSCVECKDRLGELGAASLMSKENENASRISSLAHSIVDLLN